MTKRRWIEIGVATAGFVLVALVLAVVPLSGDDGGDPAAREVAEQSRRTTASTTTTPPSTTTLTPPASDVPVPEATPAPGAAGAATQPSGSGSGSGQGCRGPGCPATEAPPYPPLSFDPYANCPHRWQSDGKGGLIDTGCASEPGTPVTVIGPAPTPTPPPIQTPEPTPIPEPPEPTPET